MMNPLLPLYINAQAFIAERREQMRENKSDKGAGLVEYGALIVLALAILGAIYASGILDTIEEEVRSTLESLFTPEDPN